MKKLNIAMISDFFYPSKGGIETHIRSVSEELINLGHKVIVITHKYNDHIGFKMLGNIRVYYLDLPVLCMNTTFPSLYSNYGILKDIFEGEKIEFVHGHQTMSNLCIEGLFHATTLNLKTIITDHSLFETGAFENIVVNAFSRFVFKTIDKVIGVSYTSKENIQKRSNVPFEKIHVIPNAISSNTFYSEKKSWKKEKIVMAITRLFFRKGIDLLIGAIPLILKGNPNIKMIIVGDGPKKDEIEQVIDEYDLADRVELLNEVPYNEVGDIMRKGDVFINTSLTESFCMAILEAACCGLHVISTNVGGIHEVLPPEIITFTEPTSEGIAKKTIEALNKIEEYDVTKYEEQLKKIYNWKRVAKETESVYLSIKQKHIGYVDRIKLYTGVSSFVFRMFIVFEFIWTNYVNKIING